MIIGNIGARAGVEDYLLSLGNVNAADGFLQKSSSLRKELHASPSTHLSVPFIMINLSDFLTLSKNGWWFPRMSKSPRATWVDVPFF